MKCDKAQDEIWERVRAGEELPEEVCLHVAACKGCAQALREVKRILGLMREADRVPPSPDCRAAVMAGMSSHRSMRLAWTYACTGIGIFALLATGLLIGIHRQPDKQTAQEKPANVARRQADKLPPPQASTPAANTDVKALVREHDRLHAKKRVRPNFLKKQTPQAAREETAPSQPEPPLDDRPVAIVSVTWSKDNDYETSYAYVEVNPETGDMTTCSVERSADSVCLNVESNSGLNQSGRGT